MVAMPPAVALTLAEVAEVLNPPLTEQQLRQIVTALGWKPAGYRRDGRPGQHQRTYDAGRIMGLHAALIPFLDTP